MSYWDDANICLGELVTNGWNATSESKRHDALRMLNLLHTDSDVKTAMQGIYQKAGARGECGSMLFDPSGAEIFKAGSSRRFPAGSELIHLAPSGSINSLTGLAALLTADFQDTFGNYIQSRIRKNRTLWVAENCKTATTFMGICSAAKELGLYHFGLLTLDQPIVVYHLRTTREVVAIKPTWAHAFDGWYFDPFPEGHIASGAHGKARCLETGNLVRKEWVIHPDEMGSALEVVQVYLSHDVGEPSAMPDFKALGVGYWAVTEARVKQLQRAATL